MSKGRFSIAPKSLPLAGDVAVEGSENAVSRVAQTPK